MESNKGMGFFGWLFLGLIILGICGIGPCSSCFKGCGPQLYQGETE
jgi:hypothetical protein